MRGGPRSFPQGSTCPMVLWILPRCLGLRLRGSHPLRPAFPGPFRCPPQSLPQSEPQRARALVWAPPVPLAATPGITFVFFSSGYLDVSVHRVPPACLCVRHAVAGVSPAGSPHSDTRGSGLICSSPRLFAACRVFHRLLVPRHPPCALLCLTCSILLLHPFMPSVALLRPPVLSVTHTPHGCFVCASDVLSISRFANFDT